MRKHYNNFRELDNDIKILQLQKDIAVAKLQNRVQTTVAYAKEQAAAPIWVRAAKVTQQVVYLSRHQIISIATEFLLRKWLFRKRKQKAQ